MPHHDLRALLLRRRDEIAEVLFCLSRLPLRHANLDYGHYVPIWLAALQDLARLVEAEAGAAREDAGGVAVAEVAEEVGLDLRAGEELGVDLGVVEARHRAAVEA